MVDFTPQGRKEQKRLVNNPESGSYITVSTGDVVLFDTRINDALPPPETPLLTQ
jgi:hypothetical protein